MPNMDYCRFENTSQDLADCLEALREMEPGDYAKLSSDYERRGFKRLLRLCVEVVKSAEDATCQPLDELMDDGDVLADAYVDYLTEEQA